MNTECTCVSKVERELAQLSFAMDDLRLFLAVSYTHLTLPTN